MQDLVDLALNVLNVKGATYGDIRVIDTIREAIYVKNGNVTVLEQEMDKRVGIRVIKNGAWGFAASSELSKESIERTATLAVKIAESSARLKVKDVVLGEAQRIVDKYVHKIEIDPFTVPIRRKDKFIAPNR